MKNNTKALLLVGSLATAMAFAGDFASMFNQHSGNISTVADMLGMDAAQLQSFVSKQVGVAQNVLNNNKQMVALVTQHPDVKNTISIIHNSILKHKSSLEAIVADVAARHRVGTLSLDSIADIGMNVFNLLQTMFNENQQAIMQLVQAKQGELNNLINENMALINQVRDGAMRADLIALEPIFKGYESQLMALANRAQALLQQVAAGNFQVDVQLPQAIDLGKQVVNLIGKMSITREQLESIARSAQAQLGAAGVTESSVRGTAASAGFNF